MNYNEALEYIHSVDWKGSRPGLSRITELLSKLDNPQNDFRVVHVAGTNGKGSFCAMLESILREQGYKTGLFTSPFIEYFNERICLNAEMIPDSDLALVTEKVKIAADTMTDAPTEFELVSAICFVYFSMKKVDIAVIECGMGGRLDCTNIFETPLLSVITGIALDHMEYLGDSVDKIAYEKAGIIKKDRPVLYGNNDPKALEVIKNKCTELNCQIIIPEIPEVVDMSITGTSMNYKSKNGQIEGAFIKLLGYYQPYNVANVIEAAWTLRKNGFEISDMSIKNGLETARWKGRFECLRYLPPVYFDGAHNVQGVEYAAKTIKHYYPDGAVIVMGVLCDKDYKSMVKTLAPVANIVHTVTPPSKRALSAESLANVWQDFGNHATAHAEYVDAFRAAKRSARESRLPIIAIGSLYNYMEVVGAINRM